MLRRLFTVLVTIVIPVGLGLSGCSADEGGGPAGPGSGGSAGSSGSGGSGGICLLNSCTTDDHCAGCSFGRTRCDLATNRCIACDPVTGEGCPAGQKCSSFGTCGEKDCPVDASGQPTITCTSNADCAGCDPKHQICDTASGKCIACTPTNTSNCLPSDICVDGNCQHKCPDSCQSDNDCGKCDTGEGPLKGCYNHECSQCSDTWACAVGQECQKGKCVTPCGLPGTEPGTCTIDSDCTACGDPTTGTAAWKCKKPINGGTHGTCSAPAAGCSDLGQSVVVLPAPFDQITNTCSTDSDCSGVGIQFNVGELIRDLVGGPELDLGIDKVKINDANVFYGMSSCASIEIADKSCGLCVPCKQDSDCKSIELDPLLKQIFKDDPYLGAAGIFLLNLLYGDDAEHELYFQCLPVAAGYGACVPCANPTQACGQTSGGGTGTCAHDVCSTGGPLNSSCGACAAEVCKNDSFCCNSSWDSLCVSSVDKYCAAGCGGSGSGCAHDPCTTGAALSSLCSPCVKAVCDLDGFCCNTQSGSWDQICVDKTNQTSACSSACGGGCAHSECSTGGPLVSSCSACATAVCNADSYCCSTDWDSLCIDEAKQQSACSC